MKADSEASVAVFLSIRNSRAQREAISAAANVALEDRPLEVFTALINIYRGLDAQRTDLAHGLFGMCDKITEGVIWCEAASHAAFVVRAISDVSLSINIDELEKGISVYQDTALERLFTQMLEFWKAVQEFAMYVRRPGKGEEQLNQLYASPQIQRELIILGAAQQNNR